MQTEDGKCVEPHSISAGSIIGNRPLHAHLFDRQARNFLSATMMRQTAAFELAKLKELFLH